MVSPRYAAFQTFNPLRPLAWRWERAQHLVQSESRFLPRRDDESTLRAARYLRTLARCRTDRQVEKLLAECHDIHTARAIYEMGGHRKLEIDARLLARETSSAIATKCSLSVEIVETYEHLFFHVTDRLDARDYVLTQAIGFTWSDWPAQRDFQALVKGFAYFAGVMALELLLATLCDVRNSPVFSEVGDSEIDPRLRARMKLAVATTMLPMGKKAGSTLRLHRLTSRKPSNSDHPGAQSPHVDVDVDRLLEETYAGWPLHTSQTQPSEQATMDFEAVATASA